MALPDHTYTVAPPLSGIEIHVVKSGYYRAVPVKVPKRKNRRIRKKAIKRYGYKSVWVSVLDDGQIIVDKTRNAVYCNERTVSYLRRKLNEQAI